MQDVTPGNNYLKEITEIYAYVSHDENGEGLIGMTMNIKGENVFMPFVCADKLKMELLKPSAKDIARQSRKTVKLIRLSVREELEVYERPD